MFSKTCEYALRAILYVALNSTEQNKIGIKEIAKALNLPVHFLGKILQNLVKYNVLQSTKGPKGGFYLDNKARKTPLIEVITIIDGADPFKKCGLGLKECSDKHPCPIHHEFKPYRDNLRKLLAKKTIKDITTVIEAGNAFVSND